MVVHREASGHPPRAGREVSANIASTRAAVSRRPTYRGPMKRTRIRQYARDPRAQLLFYAVVLALIAFWPSPVDAGARPFLGSIARVLPWATHARIEFAANIVLFVPLGLLLVAILPTSRYLVLPVSIVATVAIESAQALLLARRTPSVLDIVANVTGACIGMLVAVLLEARQRRTLDDTRRAGVQGTARGVARGTRGATAINLSESRSRLVIPPRPPLPVAPPLPPRPPLP